MARIVWTREALVRLREIRFYIAQFDPVAARRMAARLLAAGEALADFPERGRPGPAGTRQLPSVRPYVISYGVAADTVIILDIRHGAQAPRGDGA